MTLDFFKQALLICIILQIGGAFFAADALGQASPVTTSEVGIGIGGANYTGELAPNYRILNNQPALTAFYRRDMSSAITLRAGLMGSHRIVDDNTFADAVYEEDRPYHEWRNAELRLSLLELSAVMEYNFLDYRSRGVRPRLSPYLFAGVAGLLYNHKLTSENPAVNEKNYDTGLTVAIPFGVGVKYALSRHWNLGLEFGARKLFTDKLDALAEDFGDEAYVANPNDNDWYYYNGISISYTFYRTNCPSPYSQQPGLLD